MFNMFSLLLLEYVVYKTKNKSLVVRAHDLSCIMIYEEI